MMFSWSNIGRSSSGGITDWDGSTLFSIKSIVARPQVRCESMCQCKNQSHDL